MLQNSYSEINLHIVWHTKNSAPLLTPEIETVAHAAIRQRIRDTLKVFFHAIGGTETHVHVAVSIPPTLLISTFIGELKGGSSHTINQIIQAQESFAWQVGYGVVNFGTRDLEWVRNYIHMQKEHHAACKIYERLERITEPEDSVEPPSDAHEKTHEFAGKLRPTGNDGPTHPQVR